MCLYGLVEIVQKIRLNACNFDTPLFQYLSRWRLFFSSGSPSLTVSSKDFVVLRDTVSRYFFFFFLLLFFFSTVLSCCVSLLFSLVVARQCM